MKICDGFECDNEKYNRGCICCNECVVRDCKDRCEQEWKNCGQGIKEIFKLK
ncbi:hypothetical protein [Clostridium cuniculi]|uniref:hypothetical protein n=1 Tax=Clostridium cuniculi TaxID=2548455 RepID=UPI00140FF210|nr:hypothetical protein [Clostridium cuniculi]